MGLKVIGEHPYAVRREDGQAVYIHDFNAIHTGPQDLDLQSIEPAFRETLTSVWLGTAENDGFNRLVLGARLAPRQVTVLRAAASTCCRRGSPGARPTWSRRWRRAR
jgi:glutamate dehydrogenase